MKNTLFLLLVLPALLGPLSGCSIFRDEEEVQPAELVDFEAEIEIDRLWRVNVGNGQGDKYNRLRPAIAGNTLYAASNDGTVMALNRQNGQRLWRTRLRDVAITGGVGAGGGLVLVGTENSSVVALSQENGQVLWESTVSSEVLSAPATNGRMVVAQSVDGNLAGLDAETGEQRWLYENTVPALTLRGDSSPLIFQDFVIAAFGNGTVVSVALDNGTLRWEQRIAIPTGRSEIDRMVDIDGELLLADSGILLAPSYQGFLAALDPVTGQMRWRVEESSAQGAGFGFGNVYVADERSHVKAYRIGQNTPVWRNEQLDLRQVSAPVAIGNYVALGDFEGYVHYLSQVDGRFMGRTRVDRDGVRAQMLARDGVLYVYGNGGDLAALRAVAR